MTALEELKEMNRKLTLLLDDPQPGLITWNQFVCSNVKEMYNLIFKNEER